MALFFGYLVLPIYIHDDGKEVAHDAAQTVATISRLNGEAKANRERYEKAELTLKAFEGIDDPAAAKKAIETLKNFDDKKLVDAGEVEKIKTEAIKAVEDRYAPIVQERDAFQAQLHNELIGGGFARSKYIQDNLSVPADMIQAQFGKNFKIEEGKVVAYGADGQKIYSRSRYAECRYFGCIFCDFRQCECGAHMYGNVTHIWGKSTTPIKSKGGK